MIAAAPHPVPSILQVQCYSSGRGCAGVTARPEPRYQPPPTALVPAYRPPPSRPTDLDYLDNSRQLPPYRPQQQMPDDDDDDDQAAELERRAREADELQYRLDEERRRNAAAEDAVRRDAAAALLRQQMLQQQQQQQRDVAAVEAARREIARREAAQREAAAAAQRQQSSGPVTTRPDGGQRQVALTRTSSDTQRETGEQRYGALNQRQAFEAAAQLYRRTGFIGLANTAQGFADNLQSLSPDNVRYQAPRNQALDARPRPPGSLPPLPDGGDNQTGDQRYGSDAAQ